MRELIEKARPEAGGIVVVGCSSSEVLGEQIGSHSSLEAAQAVFDGIYPVLCENGLYLAAQCCEHLNRALVVERAVQQRERLERVNVIPQPKAGGSFGTTAYARLREPVMVSSIAADCGMDIGDTLIGMHLRRVAVPVRLSIRQIEQANLVCARVRAPFVGGSRAVYEESLL